MNPDERAQLDRQRRIATTPSLAIERHEPLLGQRELFGGTAMAKRPLNVYWSNYDGRSRRMVAARSWSEAARLMGMSASHAREYGSITGNAEDIATATAEPGVVFEQDTNGSIPWFKVVGGPPPCHRCGSPIVRHRGRWCCPKCANIEEDR